MIVVPIVARDAKDAERQIAAAGGADAVELRLDAFRRIKQDEVKRLVEKGKCIVTNRSKKEGGLKRQKEKERIGLLAEALDAKPFAVDMELRTDARLRKKVERKAKAGRVKVIVSFHDFRKTPPAKTLRKIVEAALKEGDFAKVVCLPKKEGDARALLRLVEENKGRVAAFGLGEKASFTRILSLKKGAPFGFASMTKKTAPGQLTLEEMREALRWG